MHENKLKFELASKIVGLILVVIGIWMAFDAILLLFNIPDFKKMYQTIRVPHEYRKLMQPFENIERNFWKSIWFILVFESMLPTLLGFYLMKPNNFFSEFTYPTTDSSDGETMMDDGSFAFLDKKTQEQPFVLGETSYEATGFIKTSDRDVPDSLNWL